MLHDVAAFNELIDRRVQVVDIDGQRIGLVRWGDTVYALKTICPHELGPIEAGLVRPRLECRGYPAPLEANSDVPVISCPWHGWEFELRSGKPIFDRSGPGLKTYAVKIEGGRVFVDAGARAVGRPPSATAGG